MQICLYKKANASADPLLDFTEGAVSCLQIAVCLQAEEQVAEEYKKRPIHNHITK